MWACKDDPHATMGEYDWYCFACGRPRSEVAVAKRLMPPSCSECHHAQSEHHSLPGMSKPLTICTVKDCRCILTVELITSSTLKEDKMQPVRLVGQIAEDGAVSMVRPIENYEDRLWLTASKEYEVRIEEGKELLLIPKANVQLVQVTHGYRQKGSCQFQAIKSYVRNMFGVEFSNEDSEFFQKHPLVEEEGTPMMNTLRVAQELVDPYELRVKRCIVTPDTAISGDLEQWQAILGCNPDAMWDRSTSNLMYAEKSGIPIEKVNELFRFEFSTRMIRPCVSCGATLGEAKVAEDGTFTLHGRGGHASYFAPREKGGGGDRVVQFQLGRAQDVRWNQQPVFEELGEEQPEVKVSLLLSKMPNGKEIDKCGEWGRGWQSTHGTHDSQPQLQTPKQRFDFLWTQLWGGDPSKRGGKSTGWVCRVKKCKASFRSFTPAKFSLDFEKKEITAKCSKCGATNSLDTELDPLVHTVLAAYKALLDQEAKDKYARETFCGDTRCHHSLAEHTFSNGTSCAHKDAPDASYCPCADFKLGGKKRESKVEDIKPENVREDSIYLTTLCANKACEHMLFSHKAENGKDTECLIPKCSCTEFEMPEGIERSLLCVGGCGNVKTKGADFCGGTVCISAIQTTVDVASVTCKFCRMAKDPEAAYCGGDKCTNTHVCLGSNCFERIPKEAEYCGKCQLKMGGGITSGFGAKVRGRVPNCTICGGPRIDWTTKGGTVAANNVCRLCWAKAWAVCLPCTNPACHAMTGFGYAGIESVDGVRTVLGRCTTCREVIKHKGTPISQLLGKAVWGDTLTPAERDIVLGATSKEEAPTIIEAPVVPDPDVTVYD